jgi:hypothetical protein
MARRPTRRAALVGLGATALGAMALAVAPPFAPGAAARNPTPPRDVAFTVWRGASPIGAHRIFFRAEGDDLVVTVAIDLAVRVAGIAVYRYTHRNREVWRGGRLVSLETTTNDDGTAYAVSARAGAEGLLVTAGGRTVAAPADILPSSYWHPETPRARRLLNTQSGAVEAIAVAPPAADAVETAAGRVPARRFAMTGGIAGDFWYDEAGRLAKVAFTAKSDGSLIWYRRAD